MKLKIAHGADWHLDQSNRLQDTIDVIRAFIRDAREQAVDLIVVAGDIFERKSSPLERRAFTDLITEAAEVAPIFVVKGNHDAEHDLYPFTALDTENPVLILDRPTVTPGSAPIVTVGGGLSSAARVALIALPWFDKASMAASLPASTDGATSTRATVAAAGELLTLLRAETSRVAALGAVPILVGHVLVAGSETSTGQTLIGTTVELSPSDLADVGAAYCALGHIHKHQSWHGGRVAYSGSPQRQNFGEPEEKGWVLVTLDTEVPGWFVGAEFRPLPARRIVLLECHSDQELKQIVYRQLSGALVRVRYYTTPELLHKVSEEQIEQAALAAGAAEVKIEAVLVHETRVRSEEIVTATTTMDKIRAYWQAKMVELSPETDARVEEKLATLEAPAGNGAEEVPSEAA